ncbi:hypothetical protein KDI_56000 [Dictyobacter arantiisoli]|uniref:Uncharacterized protein n=1 Tax=Dictyobacter arantiisoli TaxID=2014874 RepID=A0A5A5TLH6_9CHLR|nr:hypothetical protein KDI_56000 [Dictyobacter arantiisoli]
MQQRREKKKKGSYGNVSGNGVIFWFTFLIVDMRQVLGYSSFNR